MGYFSNGTEGELYREAYCDRCKWDKDQNCPIWAAHLVHNYDECNNPHSILHMLIPREKAPKFGNKECFFFEPEPSMGLPLARPLRHGQDCPKIAHTGEGYLHAADDDRPYDVDGIMYCGRCHGWMGTL